MQAGFGSAVACICEVDTLAAHQVQASCRIDGPKALISQCYRSGPNAAFAGAFAPAMQAGFGSAVACICEV